MNNKLIKIKYYLLLISAKILYSFTSIFSKLASREKFLSISYCIYYLLVVVVLSIYAILWQQVLKRIDLSIAMLFKPIALILCIVWAYVIFGESISIRMIIGFAIVIVGITIVGVANE